MNLIFFFFLVTALVVLQAVSLPLANDKPEMNALILALELENLEVAFYKAGLSRFKQSDFAAANLSDSVFQRYHEILEHEEAHALDLSKILGENAPAPCNYSFPFNSVESFVNLSLIFEGVGASAYTGVMSSLTSPAIITTVAAILGTEARQAAWVGTDVVKVAPWGTQFETPITEKDAVTLADMFTTSCPSTNHDLGIQPFPSFNITGDFIPGRNVTVHPPSIPDKPTGVAFVSGLLVYSVAIDKNENVVIPSNISGQVYAFATASDKYIAGPVVLMIETHSNGTLIN